MDESHSNDDSILFKSNITPMEVIEETGSCSNVDSNEKLSETTRSPAWDYFKLSVNNNERRAVCNICSASFKLPSCYYSFIALMMYFILNTFFFKCVF